MSYQCAMNNEVLLVMKVWQTKQRIKTDEAYHIERGARRRAKRTAIHSERATERSGHNRRAQGEGAGGRRQFRAAPRSQCPSSLPLPPARPLHDEVESQRCENQEHGQVNSSCSGPRMFMGQELQRTSEQVQIGAVLERGGS